MTGSFLESKRGDRCHFEEIKYVFPISHLSDVSFDSSREPTKKRKVQHGLWERRACQWLYQSPRIQNLFLVHERSSDAGWCTYTWSETCFLLPWSGTYKFYIVEVSDDAREQEWYFTKWQSLMVWHLKAPEETLLYEDYVYLSAAFDSCLFNSISIQRSVQVSPRM